MSYKAVTINDSYVFVHPRGNADMDGDKTIDLKNLQKGAEMAQKQGRKLVTIGKFYLNKSLKPLSENLYWDGNLSTELIATNNDPFVMVDAPRPVDNGEANVMINKVWRIQNLKLKGSGTGIRPAPTYGDGEGSLFEMISCDGFDYAMDLEFCLNADIVKPAAINCKHGWKIQTGAAWGGSNSNSQSNNVRVHKPRFYARPDSVYGLWVLGCSGVVVDEPIIEGWGVKAGIRFDSLGSTVVKDFSVINGFHFECVNGAIDAALSASIIGGKISIDGYFGQHPAKIADVRSTVFTECEIKNTRWAVPKGGLFYNQNCNWEGSYNTYNGGAITNSNFASLVEGTPVQECGGVGCGTNKFKLVETPR